MTTTQADYLIVGAGVFGASTALHLSRDKPSASIVLVDRTAFPCPIAASHDINKAVRADYEDLFYCKLGLKTLERWRNDELFKNYYHQSGMITIENGDHSMGQQIIDNFKKLDAHYEAEVFNPEEMKTRFEGLFANADFSHVDEIYWNPLSGWAEAARALEATIKAAVDQGVKYMPGSVSKLVLREDACTGAYLESGQQIDAKHVILSTGAYTTKLIADSAPNKPDLQVGRRITATAICEAATEMNDAQKAKFKNMPVLVLDDHVTQGETMPITSNDQMKWIRDVSWKNTVDHSESGQSFSVPLTSPAGSQWSSPKDIPLGLRQEIETVIKGMYGDDVRDLMPNTLRMCWDGLTQDDDWYICPHPRCDNLYVATGGSFHGWKFLPILGEYVVQMLEGKLGPEEAERWAWDRNIEDLPPNPLEPMRELRDILGAKEALNGEDQAQAGARDRKYEEQA